MHQYFADKIDEGDTNSSQCTTRNNFTINDKKICNPFTKFQQKNRWERGQNPWGAKSRGEPLKISKKYPPLSS